MTWNYGLVTCLQVMRWNRNTWMYVHIENQLGFLGYDVSIVPGMVWYIKMVWYVSMLCYGMLLYVSMA